MARHTRAGAEGEPPLSRLRSPTATEAEPAPGQPSGWHLVAPSTTDAASIAAWSTSDQEAAAWVSLRTHPFSAEAVTGWWQQADVQPWLLVDPTGTPVAYGELWDDEPEDEVELARLIVDPDHRRRGTGRRLVDQLLALAGRSGRAACFVRVVPDNHAALRLYRAAGFRDVDPDLAKEWNLPQPIEYVWLEHPDLPGRAGDEPPRGRAPDDH
jgi:ribosomal protein S18 acetylase RimI-like enzyme